MILRDCEYTLVMNNSKSLHDLSTGSNNINYVTPTNDKYIIGKKFSRGERTS